MSEEEGDFFGTTFTEGYKCASGDCINHIASILQVLEDTGGKRTKVYVALSNIKKEFKELQEIALRALIPPNRKKDC